MINDCTRYETIHDTLVGEQESDRRNERGVEGDKNWRDSAVANGESSPISEWGRK